MPFKIKSFIAKSGERFSQLYATETLGFPLFYPTAYIARSIRLKTTHETQKVYLDAIKRLYEWVTINGIDLEVRFPRREFLRINEIDDLSRHLSVARLKKKSGDTISTGKSNTYLLYVADYVTWLADELISDSNDPVIKEMISAQRARITSKTSKKPGSVSARIQILTGKRLSEKAREQLHALWGEPFANLFRVADKGSRLRVTIMLHILYQTGMRRGELLALKLKDFKESIAGEGARLIIERNHDDPYDTRISQPVAKTSGRIVPITTALENQILDYIVNYRSQVPGVGFDSEDAIFVTHRAGSGQGQPLSVSNFNQALVGLRKSFPNISEIHPHLLRHDWNYRFSKKADEKKLPPEKEQEMREVLMGWKPNSDMARHYNLRHVQEQSLRFGLEVAGDTKKPTNVSHMTSSDLNKVALLVADSK